NLRSASSLKTHGGTDAKAIAESAFKSNSNAVSGRAHVSVDAHGRVAIVDHQIQATIVVEICRGASEAHTQAVESPRDFGVLEAHPAKIPKHHVRFLLKRLRRPELCPLLRSSTICPVGVHPKIAVLDVAQHAVCNEDVLTAVVVEIFNPRPPRPVCVREAGLAGKLHHSSGASVEIKSVPDVL